MLPYILPQQSDHTYEIYLMGDVDQLAAVNLSVPYPGPLKQAKLVQRAFLLQGRLDSVDDKVQEIGFITRVPIFTWIYNPIGGAGSQDGRPGLPQVTEKVPARLAVSGRISCNQTPVHGLVKKRSICSSKLRSTSGSRMVWPSKFKVK